MQVTKAVISPAVNPLVAELRVADPTLRIALINVIGQIGYPQSAAAAAGGPLDAATSPEMKAAVATRDR